ncbi:hypothetical protein SDC9_136942 [bioreactor metagenome]|uniref:Uncharacterized protein n=1 Tax=bioreactor metagenome TaxID=1076179 RepID=A0A645DKM5_9ZZZZ
MAPETPQVGLRTLLLGRCRNRHDPILAGIERTGDTTDRTAFACRIRPLEHQHQRTLRKSLVPRQQRQSPLKPFELIGITALIHLLTQLQRVEQVQVVDLGRQRRGGLARHPVALSDRQTFLQGLEQGAAHKQCAKARITAIDDGPRAIPGAGQAQGMACHLTIALVEIVEAPVTLGHPPTGLGVFLQILEALLLPGTRQVKPELHHQHPLAHQHFFETQDLGQMLIKLAPFAAALDTLANRLGVPIVEHHANLALGWQGPPVAPHERPCGLFFGRHIERPGLDMTRIHPFVEQVDRLTLARAINAIDEHHDRKTAQIKQFELCIQQGGTQRWHFGLECCLIGLMAQFSRFEHLACLR